VRRGLIVAANGEDALRAFEQLRPYAGVRWTVLSVFPDGAQAAKTKLADEAGLCRWVDGRFANRGRRDAYVDLPARLSRLVGELMADEPDALVATHAYQDSAAHPAIWQIGNVVAGLAGSDRRIELRLRAGATEPTRRRRSPREERAAEALLQMDIHGQILQRPEPGSPGVLVSPFWSLPFEFWAPARELLFERADVGRWRVIMGDTCYRNPPPDYIQPFTWARFCVDPNEREHLEVYNPDLQLIEFCQSQLTSETVFAPRPDAEKVFDFVYNARICSLKRHELLLDALELLRSQGHDFRTLLLYYPKDNEDTRLATAAVQERITRSGLDVVLWTTGERGNDDARVAEMLSKCRVGLFLSESEGPAFAIAEYLLCDLPVVAWAGLEGGGLHFLNRSNSLLFDTPEALAQTLLEARERCGDMSPRRSALEQGIGETRGRRIFEYKLAELGVVLRNDCWRLRRRLGSFKLADLCR
jgi:glycosyltransferase involved in cell wall biosynthesis